MTDRFADQMKREAGELGIALNGGQLEQFFRYYELLVERNKVMNLTAITEEQDVVTKHFTDSLSLVKLMGTEALAGKTLMDVGTGAGFPGIPLKIAFPELKVTLLDSLNKRVRFLMDVCEELGLENITAVHGRAEDFGRNLQYRERFDMCVSRAVANLASLSEYCMPFVKVGGGFCALQVRRDRRGAGSGKTGGENSGRRGRTGGEIYASGGGCKPIPDSHPENEGYFR